jgi:hypothetical protein
MKNQYFGDVHDYVKYGLLRALSGVSQLRVGLVWMLTPDDDRTDGSRTHYLKDGSWRVHDPELFDQLSRLAGRPQARSVELLRRWELIPGALDFEALVPPFAEPRAAWSAAALEALTDCPLLFFDPDNGFEVDSVPFGARASEKYLYWDEAAAAWNAGHSLLTYQHWPRESRDTFEVRLRARMAERLDGARISTFRTNGVLFVLAARPEHAAALARGAEEVARRWERRVQVGVEPPRPVGRAGELADVCATLSRDGAKAAGALLARTYPFEPPPSLSRSMSMAATLRIWRRDGFIDRYSGDRLVYPGALRLLSALLPEEFPYHVNWKLSCTHPAYWQLYPTTDHVVPVARGGPDAPENCVTTSWLRNAAKSHWTLGELGWRLLPPGSLEDWDGLTGWFRESVAANPAHLELTSVRHWMRLLERAESDSGTEAQPPV